MIINNNTINYVGEGSKTGGCECKKYNRQSHVAQN